MVIIEATVRYSQTFNLGDFSNINPSVVLKAEIHHGDIVSDLLDELKAMAKKQVHQIIDDEIDF